MSESWVIVRAGPLSYTGDREDIVGFTYHPAAHVQQPNYYAFNAYLTGRTDERGDLIGYPPCTVAQGLEAWSFLLAL